MREKRNLKVGNVVYLYRNDSVMYTITDISKVNDKTYCWLKKDPDSRCAIRYHKKFVHLVTDEEAKKRYLHRISPEYKAELKAKREAAEKWLVDRQNELAGLTFRCYETDLFPEERDLISKAGYYIYSMTDGDEGPGYNIKKNGLANRFGYWITDTDLTPYMSDGRCIHTSELAKTKIINIPHEELKPYFDEGRRLHFEKKKAV